MQWQDVVPRRSTVIAAVGVLVVFSPLAVAGALADSSSPPQPCYGVPQITDVTGDGHHASSDVTAAWFSEANGNLQAVIQVHAGTWLPEHSDADINGSGFAMVFTVGNQTDYVRTRAAPDGTLTYDYGTYSQSTFFTSVGSTTGSVVYAAVNGTTTIDVPVSAFGITAGTKLASPYVITYDGITGGVPGWVDHAPGGQEPTDPARGADYIVGSCQTSGSGGSSGSGGAGTTGTTGTTGGTGTTAGTGATVGTSGTGSSGGSAPYGTVAVQLTATPRIVGGGVATISGQVIPNAGGVSVAITRTTLGGKSVTSNVTTQVDGTFKVLALVNQITDVRAEANGIESGTSTIDVASRVHIRFAEAGKRRVIVGRVAPDLPGQALLLPDSSPYVRARTQVAHGTFRFKAGHLPAGSYQVVYVPAQGHADRSTSNTLKANS